MKVFRPEKYVFSPLVCNKGKVGAELGSFRALLHVISIEIDDVHVVDDAKNQAVKYCGARVNVRVRARNKLVLGVGVLGSQ